MSDYLRTTTELGISQLKPELMRPIRAYAQQHGLGDVEADARYCCETYSEKKKKTGFFASRGGGGADPDEANHTVLILTPAWLIWARSGPKTGTVVSAARLRDVQVSAFESKLIPDTGLDVQSPVVGSAEPVTAFIPLSPDLAPAIIERVKAAVASAGG